MATRPDEVIIQRALAIADPAERARFLQSQGVALPSIVRSWHGLDTPAPVEERRPERPGRPEEVSPEQWERATDFGRRFLRETSPSRATPLEPLEDVMRREGYWPPATAEEMGVPARPEVEREARARLERGESLWGEAGYESQPQPRRTALPAANRSSFEQKFYDLFGEQLQYNPISPRSSTGTGSSFEDRFHQVAASLERLPPQAERGMMGDYGRALGSGVAQVGQMALGALEYPLDQLAAYRQSGSEKAVGVAADVLGAGRQAMGALGQRLIEGMSPEAQHRLMREWTNLDPDKTIWQGNPLEFIDSVGLKLTQTLPSSLATLLPAGLWLRAGMSTRAINYLGASEAGLSLGAIASGIAEEVEQMPTEQLMAESPRFAQLMQEGLDEQTARDALVREAQGASPAAGALMVGAISAVAGRFLAPVITGTTGAGALRRFGRGFLAEAPQEAAQESTEQLMQNIAAQVYDTDRAPTDDLLESAAGGFVLGGLIGGGVSTALGRRRQPQRQPEPEVETEPENIPGEAFEDVFGQGRGIPGVPTAEGSRDPMAAAAPISDDPVAPEVRAALEARRATGTELEQGGQQPLPLEPGTDFQLVQDENSQMALPLPRVRPMASGIPQQEPAPPPAPATPQELEEAGQMRIPGDAFTDVVPAAGQQELPLRQRVRGVGPQPLPAGGQFPVAPPDVDDAGVPLTGYPRPASTPDFSQPPGTTAGSDQIDMFDEPFGPDRPSAEPLVDIEAQLEDLHDPYSQRMGVYLSADNLARLRADGLMDRVRGADGVHLANFDGRGGLMIARDREAADELLSYRNDPDIDMQEVLGLATGAGVGKPRDGQYVVQVRRDSDGAVIREQVAPDEEAAEHIAAQWEADGLVTRGLSAHVMTPRAAITRRGVRILREQQKRAHDREVEEALEPVKGTELEPTARRAVKGTRSRTRAAARLIGAATQAARRPSMQREEVTGFYPPDALEFGDNTDAEVTYRALHNRLVDLQLQLEYAQEQLTALTTTRDTARTDTGALRHARDSDPIHERIRDTQERVKELEEGVSRTGRRVKATYDAAQPKLKAGRLITAASKLSPEAVKDVQREASTEAKKTDPAEMFAVRTDDISDLAKLTPEDIEALTGPELDEAFLKVAIWHAGKSEALTIGYHAGGSDTAVGVPEGTDATGLSEAELSSMEGEAQARAADFGTDPTEESMQGIVTTEQIPAGATMVAFHTPPPKGKPKQEARRASFIRRGNVYHYILKRGDEIIARGRVAGPKARAEKFVNEYLKRVNKPDSGNKPIIDYVQFLNANSKAGQKRKQIRRAVQQLRQREFGGGTRPAADLVKKATEVHELEVSGDEAHLGDAVAEVGGGPTSGETAKERKKRVTGGTFDSTVLSRELVKQDESKEARAARLEEGERVMGGFDKLVPQAEKFLEAAGSKAFAELANETDPATGDLSERALNMRLARMYFRSLLEYGRALKASGLLTNYHLDGRPWGTIPQMREIVEQLRTAMSLPAAEFAHRLATLAKATERLALKRISADYSKGSATVKQRLLSPRARAELLAEHNENLFARAAVQARLARFNENSIYRQYIAPLMAKFADSTWRDGWTSYRPTEQELLELDFALRQLKGDKELFDAVRDFFGRKTGGLGFEISKDGEVTIPRNDKGEYEYRPSDQVLSRLYTARFSEESSPRIPPDLISQPEPPPRPPVRTPVHGEPFYERKRREVAQLVEDGLVTPAQGERLMQTSESTFDNVLNAYRLIDTLRRTVARTRATVKDIIAAENQFKQAMEALGLWQEIGNELARINLPTPRMHRLVGPRLSRRQMKKDEAKAALLRAFGTPRSGDGEVLSLEGEVRPMWFDQEKLDRYYGDTSAFAPLAEKLRAMVQEGTYGGSYVSGHDLLRAIVDAMPDTRHPWVYIAKRLLALQSTNVQVAWGGTTMPLQRHGAAHFDRGGHNYVLLNQFNLKHDGMFMHTLLHELTHMASKHALEHNPDVRAAVLDMQAITRSRLLAAGHEKMPYGLKPEHPPDEFISEAFTNPSFQAMLRKIHREPGESIWNRLVDLVRRIVGFGVPRNMLDAVMMTSDHVLTNTSFEWQGGATHGMRGRAPRNMLEGDHIAPTIDGALSSIAGNTRGVFRRSVEAAARGLLPAMTMNQINDAYNTMFSIGTRNPLQRYMRLFGERSAENSRLMELAEGHSREWTELTEQDPDNAFNVSELMTLATQHRMHIDRPLNHPSNKHITEDNAKAHHAELHARFKKLPKAWRDLYADIRQYYEDSRRRETLLMAQNALRAAIATGPDAPLTKAQFDQIFSQKVLEEFDDRDAFDAKVREYLTEESETAADKMITSVYNILSIPKRQQGPYFPLSRFGDYVVFATRKAETKLFSTSKEAGAYARAKRAEDPTLDVSIRVLEDGTREVTVTEREFVMAENRTEAEAARERMIAEYGADVVSDVQLRQKVLAESAIQSNSALETIMNKLKGNAAAQAAVKNFYLRSLSDRSFRKHETRRQNRKGVDAGLQHRAFTNYAKQAAYYTSQLQFGWRMADAMIEMRDFVKGYRATMNGPSNVQLGSVVGELQKRDELTTNHEELPKLITRGTELGQLMMLFSPSYWMINATQPYMVTVPWLAARYGWGRSFSSLKHAQRLILSPLVTATNQSYGGLKALWSKAAAEKAFNVLDEVKKQIKERTDEDTGQRYIRMLDELRRASAIDLTWIAELRDIAEGRNLSHWQKILDSTRVMAHLTEVNNRIATAIAAYELRYGELISILPPKEAHNVASDFAKEAVQKTQFDYSSGNKPRLFQSRGPVGKFAPWLFQFMQWPQHMYAMMIINMRRAVGSDPHQAKIARKILLNVFTTHLAAGGLIGATLQPIKWAIGLTMMAFADDDEPEGRLANALSGENFDRMVRERMAELFGPTTAQGMASGLPALLGTDLSDRMSLGSLYFLDLKTDNAESTIGSLVEGFGGPMVSLAGNVFRGSQYLQQGEYQRAAEMVMPKMFKDFSRLQRFATEGLINNTGDTAVADMSPWQLLLQGLGFQPAAVTEFYTRQSVIQDHKAAVEAYRESLVRKYRRADGPEARRKVLEEVANFNRNNRQATPITRSTLIRSMRSKIERERAFERFGASLRGRERAYADEAWYLE